MTKAVIFDMDGVVIDSEKYWQPMNMKYLSSVIPSFDSNVLHQLVGRGFSGAFDYLNTIYSISHDKSTFIRKWLDAALADVFPRAQLIPGVLDFIQLVKKKKLKTALGTSSPKEIVDCVFTAHPELADCFDAITTGEEVGPRGKPLPDLFLKTAEKIQIAPAECLVIEDADSGVAAGKAAGMVVYGFRNGMNDSQSLKGADFVFTDFTEIEL